MFCNYGFYGQFEGLRYSISIIFGIGCYGMLQHMISTDIEELTNQIFTTEPSTHLILMLSGTIAATTAFISTIELFPQEWMNWAMPSNFLCIPLSHLYPVIVTKYSFLSEYVFRGYKSKT